MIIQNKKLWYDSRKFMWERGKVSYHLVCIHSYVCKIKGEETTVSKLGPLCMLFLLYRMRLGRRTRQTTRVRKRRKEAARRASEAIVGSGTKPIILQLHILEISRKIWTIENSNRTTTTAHWFYGWLLIIFQVHFFLVGKVSFYLTISFKVVRLHSLQQTRSL